MVWDYINPVVKEGPLNQGETPALDDRNHQYNAVFKIHRYPTDYPAFDGKDLSPKGTLELYPSGVEGFGETIPKQFKLNQNYPNPFNPETVISYQLSVPGTVFLTIYNLFGHEVKTLVHEFKSAGFYQTIWDGKDSQKNNVGSGFYLYELKCGDMAVRKKMTLLR